MKLVHSLVLTERDQQLGAQPARWILITISAKDRRGNHKESWHLCYISDQTLFQSEKGFLSIDKFPSDGRLTTIGAPARKC